MEYTFLELLNIFQINAQNHLGLESFRIGERWNINQDEDILYPQLFLELPIIEYNNAQELYRWAFTICDRGAEDLSDLSKILTKTKQIAESYLEMLSKCNGDLFIFPLQYTALPFTESFEDRIHGWRLEFSIENQRSWNECELPVVSSLC